MYRYFYLIVAIGVALVLVASAYADQDYLSSWIPAKCCVTNECCYEIQERELQPLPNDNWLVRSTGQVVKRTGWSPDGKFYRCACDLDVNTQKWVKHDKAFTRCIFVPMRLGRLQ
jgi:hypothetical protein